MSSLDAFMNKGRNGP